MNEILCFNVIGWQFGPMSQEPGSAPLGLEFIAFKLFYDPLASINLVHISNLLVVSVIN